MLCAAIALATSARAQDAPFSRVGVRGGAAASAVETRFHDRWTTDSGPAVSVWMPFYLGEIEAGLLRHRHDARAGQPETLPGFYATFVYLGWSLPIVVADRFRVAPGLRLGNLSMTFDDTDPEPNGSTIWVGYDLDESEAGAALTLRLDARIAGPLRAHLQGSAQRVFTSTRTDFGWFEAGLSYSIRAPQWVREVFE